MVWSRFSAMKTVLVTRNSVTWKFVWFGRLASGKSDGRATTASNLHGSRAYRTFIGHKEHRRPSRLDMLEVEVLELQYGHFRTIPSSPKSRPPIDTFTLAISPCEDTQPFRLLQASLPTITPALGAFRWINTHSGKKMLPTAYWEEIVHFY